MNKDKEVAELMLNGMFNFHKFILKDKPHIKKYNKLRKLHSEIINNMEKYLDNGKYNRDEYFEKMKPELQKIANELNYNFKINLDSNNASDSTIIDELFIYKTSTLIPSVTEIYINNNKFKNKDKEKMLECMNNSYVSLFKVVDTDFNNGIITYQDVFTNKKYKVIDVSMSTSLKIFKRKDVYIYNRIITYEDISFGTGINCVLYYDNKYLRRFLNKQKNIKCSDFIKCLLFYNMKQLVK